MTGSNGRTPSASVTCVSASPCQTECISISANASSRTCAAQRQNFCSVVASLVRARHAHTPSCQCQFQFLKPDHKEERCSRGVTCASAQRMSYRFSVRYPSTDPAYHPSSPIHCASTASPIAKARPSLLHWRDVSMQPLFGLSLRFEDFLLRYGSKFWGGRRQVASRRCGCGRTRRGGGRRGQHRACHLGLRERPRATAGRGWKCQLTRMTNCQTRQTGAEHVRCGILVHGPGLRRPGLLDNAEILDPRAPACVIVLSILGEGENPMQDAARQARMTACMRSVCIVVYSLSQRCSTKSLSETKLSVS